ncbi:MAG TPA: hypothetical protein VEL03_19165 [Streptosporangiaceae bacterium]|nr:hypothetical protein [Streptosporangiaceae bacterium]
MSADLEEMLSAELCRRTEAIVWQPAVLDRALDLHRALRRRRRMAMAGGVACALAAAVVVSLSAGTQETGDSSVHGLVTTAAYVVTRVRAAIGGAHADVLEVRSRTSIGWSYSAWFDPATGQSRVDVYPPGGAAPVLYYLDSSGLVTVDYQSRTYTTGHVSQQWQQLIVPVWVSWDGLDAPLPTPAAIRHALAAGSYRLVGTKTVGGTRLLQLRWTRPAQHAGLGGYGSLDLWVNAVTYLPVSSVTDESAYAPRMESTFAWRPATRRTQAIFTPEIPAGFRHLTLPFLPLLQHR